ncbi:MAG: sugar ABC transporter substrate-binding protein [Chloroflexi bacterium]|nr:sugar ABC transporter substrate-binding protein [Chloroflexota bacterium]
MKTRAALVLILLVASFVLGACAAPATPQVVVQTQIVEKPVQSTVIVQQTAVPAKHTVTIGFAAPGLVGGQINIQETILRYAQDKGWQVVVTNSNGDAQKQNDDIDQLIAQGVDAIVTVPQDSAGICAAAEKAKAANIPFFTVDRSPIGCAIDLTLLSDNRLAGQQAGQAMVDALKAKYGSEKGTVLEITGDLGQNVGQLRRDGFHDIVDKYPDIKVIQKVGNWDAQKGAEAVREVLTANPDLDGIYMHSDAVYISGTLAELKAANKLFKVGETGHVILTSVDGSPAGVQAVKDGWADESSNQPIPDFGLVLDFVEKVLNGETLTEGQLTKDGALWSPAVIKKNADGTLECFLSTTAVTAANADNPGLWANFTVN